MFFCLVYICFFVWLFTYWITSTCIGQVYAHSIHNLVEYRKVYIWIIDFGVTNVTCVSAHF